MCHFQRVCLHVLTSRRIGRHIAIMSDRLSRVQHSSRIREMSTTTVTTTYLEMLSPAGFARSGSPMSLPDRRGDDAAVAVQSLPVCAVGEEWHWNEKAKLDRRSLARIRRIGPSAHIRGLLRRLARRLLRIAPRRKGGVEIVYLGLLPVIRGPRLRRPVGHQCDRRSVAHGAQPRLAAHLHARPSGGADQLPGPRIESVPS